MKVISDKWIWHVWRQQRVRQQKLWIKKITTTLKKTRVNTEQIGADDDGDKVMQDNRTDDDDAKLHFTTVQYEAGDVTAAVDKVKNSRLSFSTDLGELDDFCGYFNSSLRNLCMM